MFQKGCYWFLDSLSLSMVPSDETVESLKSCDTRFVTPFNDIDLKILFLSRDLYTQRRKSLRSSKKYFQPSRNQIFKNTRVIEFLERLLSIKNKEHQTFFPRRTACLIDVFGLLEIKIVIFRITKPMLMRFRSLEVKNFTPNSG